MAWGRLSERDRSRIRSGELPFAEKIDIGRFACVYRVDGKEGFFSVQIPGECEAWIISKTFNRPVVVSLVALSDDEVLCLAEEDASLDILKIVKETRHARGRGKRPPVSHARGGP